MGVGSGWMAVHMRRRHEQKGRLAVEQRVCYFVFDLFLARKSACVLSIVLLVFVPLCVSPAGLHVSRNISSQICGLFGGSV